MDENKLEFTDVHDRFKSLVETLLSDFLGEMGVSADMFVEIVANSVHLQLNSFVLASILTVVGPVLSDCLLIAYSYSYTPASSLPVTHELGTQSVKSFHAFTLDF